MKSTLGDDNPLRYRGYVYDRETGLYYLQSRYYNPAIGRFINADIQLSTGSLAGINLFAYCNNNPLIYTDSTGMAPKWWQWVVSGAMFVAGVAMIATGAGSSVGGVLVCASVNSIISSYSSEAIGGTATAGWVGGMITGAVCGTGAGLAGNLLSSATEAAGLWCLGKAAASCSVAFGFGFAGSYAGQSTSAAIDGKTINKKETVNAALTTGSINCFAGIGAGMGNAITDLPAISTTTHVFANSLNAGWSVASEAALDTLSFIIGIFS